MEILKVKMITQPMKIRADFNLYCITFEGVEAVKYSLIEGEKVSTPEMEIKYRVIGSPTYECNIITTNTKEGLKLMGESLRTVEKTIKAKGGSFALLTAPTILGDASKDVRSQLEQQEEGEKISEEGEEDEFQEGIQADIYAAKDIIG